MALDKPYADIPGTTVFDAEMSRRGYPLNQFCMSLMQAHNRERFRADERAYLDEWPMSAAQKSAVLARDYNAMLAEGGNIYFLAKIFATDGKSFVHAAAQMTGMSEDEYQAMMLAGGRSPQGASTGSASGVSAGSASDASTGSVGGASAGSAGDASTGPATDASTGSASDASAGSTSGVSTGSASDAGCHRYTGRED